MIASLPMYARPELDAPHARYWTLIRDRLAARGLDAPDALSQDTPEWEAWQSPNLVLGQTCGLPYRSRLHGAVALIGTPDYALDGCPPGYYRSAVVVRRQDPRHKLEEIATARLACNGLLSQSGHAALWAEARALGLELDNLWISGSHRASAQAVAAGRADIAALDAVSWRLMQRFDDFAAELRVLHWTTPTPGLPYIAWRGADAKATFDAVAEAIAALSPDDRDALGLCGLVAIAPEDYLAVPTPPDLFSAATKNPSIPPSSDQ